MASHRTFLALDLSATVRNQILKLKDRLASLAPQVKWVEPDNLHLTLLFLGDVDERELMNVCRGVQDVADRHAPLDLTIQGLGAFPNFRRPRTIWVGVGPGVESLMALHADLESTLIDRGCYRREDRAYRAHITLGRCDASEGIEPMLEELQKKQDWSAGNLIIEELVVYTSELTRKGPIYAVMARSPFSG